MPPQTLQDDDLIPAIGYIRVSMAREEMISPELQRSSITEWARRNGRRIVEWIEDLDATGRNFKRRVIKAIEAVKTGRVREIIVWKFSRFGRQRLGWAVHLDLVESAGGALVSATEEVDAHTASGRFARGMLAEVAAFESDRASEGWKETLSHRVKKGLPATGGPRFGYIRRGRIPNPFNPQHYVTDPDDPLGERYEPDPDLTDAYRSLYERYVDGTGAHTLVTWLNTHGILNAAGSIWVTQTFYQVMDSGFAAGYLREHEKHCRCKQRGRCLNTTYVPGAHKAIISDELWQRYLTRRAAQRQVPSQARNPVYPFSGLPHCAGCKTNMTAIGGGEKRGRAYRCNQWGQTAECTRGYVSRAYLEASVLGQLGEWDSEIQAEAARTKVTRSRVHTAAPDTGALTREIAKIDRALTRLTKLRVLDEDDRPEAEQAYLATRDELRADRAALEVQIQAAAEAPPEREDYVLVIRALLEEWETMPAARRRELARSIIRVIWVYRTGEGTTPRLEIVPVWADE